MLTDRENRPALAVTLASHALMMGLLAVAACFAPLENSIIAVLIVFPIILLFFITNIAGIAWLVEIPFVRKLNDSPSQFRQGVGCVLFLVGLIAIVGAAVASWASMHVWSYLGFALLSGFVSFRQFRRSALEEQVILVPSFPVARLVNW